MSNKTCCIRRRLKMIKQIELQGIDTADATPASAATYVRLIFTREFHRNRSQTNVHRDILIRHRQPE
jgi:hypothetical protein